MAQQKPLVVGAYGEPARIQGGDTIDPAVLGSGTRDGTRFLRDDGSYVALPGGGTSAVTYNVSGAFSVPLTGTARRYFSAARSFSKATIGVATAPSATLTATIKVNGSSVGTITVASGQFYNTNVQSIAINAGDYLTVDVSGAGASDLVLTLE